MRGQVRTVGVSGPFTPGVVGAGEVIEAGEGVDHDFAEPALRSLGPRGRYLVVGFASGRIATLPMNQILLRNRTVVGVEWATWITANTQHLACTLEVVLNRLARGVLHPPKPHLVPMHELPQTLTGPLPANGLVRTVVVPS